MKTRKDRKQAEYFRKFLDKNGYQRLQKSVYVKLLKNAQALKTEKGLVCKVAPNEGDICILPLDLPVFKRMRILSEYPFDVDVFSEDYVII